MQQATYLDITKKRDRFNITRPQKLNLEDISNTSYKWAECKVLGKNILIRSYAGACTDSVHLYVYGGLQILKRTLSDFNRINLDINQQKFQWEEVPVNNGSDGPGPRAKHALVYSRQRIYLIGGIKSGMDFNNDISNDIYVYSLAKGSWTKLQPKGTKLPPMESFGCIYVEGDQDRIIMLCGYQGQKSSPISDVYEYNINTNTVEKLYDSTGKSDGPVGRFGCGCSFNGQKFIYIFGGKAEQRLNDLWRFNLQSNMYQRVKDSEEMRPNIRNGHSMTYYEGKLYVFGGIHEVTWQLDDLHIFDTKDNTWMTSEVDSARKKESTPLPRVEMTELTVKQAISARECFSATNKKDRSYHHGARLTNHKNINYDLPQDIISSERNSPSKMRDEQRKKAFMQKKAQLLKTFEIPENEKQKFIFIQPASQAMKNSLDMIGSLSNPISKNKTLQPVKLTQFGKTTYSKFMQPLVNKANVIVGKRPCARDGHCAIMIGNQQVIFGGDRHQMSFNDLYKLNMLVARRQNDTENS